MSSDDPPRGARPQRARPGMRTLVVVFYTFVAVWFVLSLEDPLFAMLVLFILLASVPPNHYLLLPQSASEGPAEGEAERRRDARAGFRLTPSLGFVIAATATAAVGFVFVLLYRGTPADLLRFAYGLAGASLALWGLGLLLFGIDAQRDEVESRIPPGLLIWRMVPVTLTVAGVLFAVAAAWPI